MKSLQAVVRYLRVKLPEHLGNAAQIEILNNLAALLVRLWLGLLWGLPSGYLSAAKL